VNNCVTNIGHHFEQVSVTLVRALARVLVYHMRERFQLMQSEFFPKMLIDGIAVNLKPLNQVDLLPRWLFKLRIVNSR
jgi:hypothetical protein